MSRLTGWLYSLRSLVRRDDADRDTADEIAFHVDQQTRKHESRGLSNDEARSRALREFGGTTRWREEARHARGSTLLDDVEQDIRQTVRGLRRDPVFVTMAVVTLGLAIGANAAMFGIIDRLMLRGPEHVVAPERVARVYVTRVLPSAKVVTSGWQPYVLYRTARDDTPAITAAAAYAPARLRVGAGAESRLVSVAYATFDLFSVTGARPAVGRFYSADEDRPPAGEQVVVLGYGYWQREFAGASSIVGRSIALGDRNFRVVGVAPRGFTGVELSQIDAWIPMSARPVAGSADWATNWRSSPMSIVVRLATSRDAAAAQLTTLLRRAYAGPDRAMRNADVSLRPTSYTMDGVAPAEVGVARLLAGVALVMLLVAAANTTNLILARAVRRRRELGVRVALGAGRGRVIRLMIVESVTIALAGGMLGLTLAHWGGAIIRRALLPNVAWAEMPVDGRVLLWTAIATLATGVIVGLIPGLRVSGGDVASALRTGRTGSGSDSHGAARALLQIAQLALSLVLVFTAGLFVRSLRDIGQLDLGYDRDHVLSIDITFSGEDSSSAGAAARQAVAAKQRYETLRAQLAQVPGVTSASIGFGSPLSELIILAIRVPGIDSLLPANGGRPLITAAAPAYFETVGTRIVRGRGFRANDTDAASPVIVVNETMARMLWPGLDPIGRCVLFGLRGDTCARVVGVAQNVHHTSLKEPPVAQCYIPWGQDHRFVAGSVLLARTKDEARALAPAITSTIRRAIPDARGVEVRTFEQLLDPQLRPWRVSATLFGVFGAIVVAVSAIGLFSVVSYIVTQTTHELGVRIALGAQQGHVLRLVMSRGVRTAVAGVVVGGAASLAVGPLIQPLLFDNPARDPLMLAGVAAGLLGVAAAASLWPSWRATRIDPLLALRAD